MFECVAQMELARGPDVSASEIKKELRTRQPVNRSQSARALDELVAANLLEKPVVNANLCQRGGSIQMTAMQAGLGGLP